jgi:hypothetical protein
MYSVEICVVTNILLFSDRPTDRLLAYTSLKTPLTPVEFKSGILIIAKNMYFKQIRSKPTILPYNIAEIWRILLITSITCN